MKEQAGAKNDDHDEDNGNNNISNLLEKLSIKGSSAKQQRGDPCDDSKSLQHLQREIDRTGFRIFECIADLGYFSWNPPRGAKYQNLASITNSTDLTEYLDLSGTPPILLRPLSVKTPRYFSSYPPDEHRNKFPFGNTKMTSLYVAACHRAADLSTIDFAFGGSTLEVLATHDTGSNPYVVTLVPGTENNTNTSSSSSSGCTILVVKNKEYIQNLSDPGFQFERLVTGKPMKGESSDTVSSVEHIQIMDVSGHRVLFGAEADAVHYDNDHDPVEIKASNPRYWGTKVMFQMISNGSTSLCHGTKQRGSVTEISIRSLHDVSKDAVPHRSSVERLEDNIRKSMASLKTQLVDAKPGVVFHLSFVRSELVLTKARGRSADILPPEDIVLALLSEKK